MALTLDSAGQAPREVVLTLGQALVQGDSNIHFLLQTFGEQHQWRNDDHHRRRPRARKTKKCSRKNSSSKLSSSSPTATSTSAAKKKKKEKIGKFKKTHGGGTRHGRARRFPLSASPSASLTVRSCIVATKLPHVAPALTPEVAIRLLSCHQSRACGLVATLHPLRADARVVSVPPTDSFEFRGAATPTTPPADNSDDGPTWTLDPAERECILRAIKEITASAI